MAIRKSYQKDAYKRNAFLRKRKADIERQRDRARDKDPVRKMEKHRAGWEYHIKKSYGLTPEDVAWMYVNQSGKCAVCLDDLDFFSDSTHIDHEHATMKVRGLLCIGCNLAIGAIKERKEVLFRMVEYLDKNK